MIYTRGPPTIIGDRGIVCKDFAEDFKLYSTVSSSLGTMKLQLASSDSSNGLSYGSFLWPKTKREIYGFAHGSKQCESGLFN